MKYENNLNANFINHSYLNSSHHTNEKIIEELTEKAKKLKKENDELRKINRSLNAKINLLLNDNTIIKNVKNDIQDYSDYSSSSHYTHEDTLKEFFYLLTLSEKMKFLDVDEIWMIDSGSLYREVQSLDLPFYQWQSFIDEKLNNEFTEIKKKVELKQENGLFSKLKNLWYDSSLSFYNKIKSERKPAVMLEKNLKEGNIEINQKKKEKMKNENENNHQINQIIPSNNSQIKTSGTSKTSNIALQEDIERLLILENSFDNEMIV